MSDLIYESAKAYQMIDENYKVLPDFTVDLRLRAISADTYIRRKHTHRPEEVLGSCLRLKRSRRT